MPEQHKHFGQSMSEWARSKGGKSNPYIYNIVTHGAVNAVLLPDGEWGDAKAFAQWVRAQPDYRPGQGVNLIACWAAYCETSGFAKQLSHELNVPVGGWNEAILFDPFKPMPPWTEYRLFQPDGTYEVLPW